jgi:Kef-type K+ transport system membrane component KefB
MNQVRGWSVRKSLPDMTSPELAPQLFVQIATVLALCHALGFVARRFGQPQVVAEMLAGVVLGPSLLGLLWPQIMTGLFPRESLPVFSAVAQIALVAYMFIVGLEFKADLAKSHLRCALSVAVAGMVAPFLLGGLLGWYFHSHTGLFPANTTLTNGAIFLGAAMSITAFPVLARLIAHKKLGGTTMGTVALGAGAMNDAAAWSLLAVVLASIDGQFSRAFINIAAGATFVAAVLLLLRPLLARWALGVERRGRLSDGEFVLCLALIALGSWCTDRIGLHAVFGAFIIGVAMPRGLVAATLNLQIRPMMFVLLPLFFACSGLNTRMGLLDSTRLWIMALLVLAAAIAGKGVACWAAARLSGLNNREAMGIGTLMNVRGLMELIIINIGLQRGIISPELFAILVIMAVTTTIMASPLFEWAMRSGRSQPAFAAERAHPARGTVPTAEPGGPEPTSA